jgi:hypothetical protein
VKKTIYIGLLASILVTACSTEPTKVKIWFNSSQIDIDFKLTAAHALAVSQKTDTKIYLFKDEAVDCSKVYDQSSIGELYIPKVAKGPFGAKFGLPGKGSWAGMINDRTPPVTELNTSDATVTGKVDFSMDVSKSGNVGGMIGHFTAKMCPPNPLANISSKKGSSDIKISMEYPDKSSSWDTSAGTAIAFMAGPRLMLFFHETDELTCENYRLKPKKGMIEFDYSTPRNTFTTAEVIKAAPVDPKTGWSHHYDKEQIEVLKADATISPDKKTISGSVDINLPGMDPMTISKVHKNAPEVQKWAPSVKGHISGTFTAPFCPEF